MAALPEPPQGCRWWSVVLHRSQHSTGAQAGRWQAQATMELVDAGQCPLQRWCCAWGRQTPGLWSRTKVETSLAELMGGRRAEPGLAVEVLSECDQDLPCPCHLSLDQVGTGLGQGLTTDTGRQVCSYNAPASAGGGGWAQPEQGVTASTKSWGREQQ